MSESPDDPSAQATPENGETRPAGEVKETSDPKPLSPEEQMARYEDALKEDDWGHQPC